MRRTSFALSLVASLAAAACSADGAAAGTQQSDTASGVVKDSQGKAIAGASVDVVGNATANGNIVDYTPQTSAAGAYQVSGLTPATNYTVNAWKQITYNGRQYYVGFAPVGGGVNDQFDSRPGIVRDFVWKLSGPVPGADAPSTPAVYGATVVLYNVDSYLFPEQAKAMPQEGSVTLRLVPDGPLIDGSAGQTIEVTAPLAPKELRLATHADVPVGRYTASATVTDAAGTTKPLRVSSGAVIHDESAFAATATVEFQPAQPVRPYHLGGSAKDSGVHILP